MQIENENHLRQETKKCIWPQTFTQNKPLAQKKHYFEYKEECIKEVLSKEKEKDMKAVVSEELKFLSKYGFSKKTLETMPNHTLMNFNIKQGIIILL